MYSSTPFQYLPPHIVRLIVNHVIVCAQSGRDKERLLTPLLWVCHNFRVFVVLRFFRECELDLGFGDNADKKSCVSWPSSPLEPVFSAYHLAKSLMIKLEAWRVCSGDVLRILSAPPFDGVAFPLVTKLTVDLHCSCGYGDDGDIEEDFPSNSTSNIGDFVRHIKQMVPAVSEISLWTNDEWAERDSTGELHFGDLYARLFGITKTTMLNDYCDEMGRYLNLDLIRDLVSFSSLGTQTDQVLSLVRRNARTLQRLDLDIYHATDISGLLQDLDSGKHMEYPHLHTLKLGSTPKY
ncbi:hypothetical protein H4218_006259, partial [Coemansia sp. IMI 209128]